MSVPVILGEVDGMLLILVLVFGYGYDLFDSFDVDLVWRVVVDVCGFVFRLLVFSGCYLMVWIWLVGVLHFFALNLGGGLGAARLFSGWWVMCGHVNSVDSVFLFLVIWWWFEFG